MSGGTGWAGKGNWEVEHKVDGMETVEGQSKTRTVKGREWKRKWEIKDQ